ncbi:hypothetical protein KKA49_04080, partial [Patescibacteria group bacterium]|nr:hypothetical protein [Patescibacteria group bacterium]MBU1457860.1 hypothetical protein [Patescibacteria group bacterium]
MSQNILLCNKCGATKPPGNAKNCWKPECDGTYVTTPIAHPTPRTQNIHNRWDEPDEEEVETPR